MDFGCLGAKSGTSKINHASTCVEGSRMPMDCEFNGQENGSVLCCFWDCIALHNSEHVIKAIS